VGPQTEATAETAPVTPPFRVSRDTFTARAHLFEDEAEVETATAGDLEKFCDFIDQNAGASVPDPVDESGFVDPIALSEATQRGVDERVAASVDIDEQEIKAIG
jgi:hypothetical protein